MSIEQYQGLLRLTLGAATFFIIMLLLRIYSMKKEKTTSKHEDNKWFGVEELVISDVLVETKDIMSFRLRRKNGKILPQFKAGQFLSFLIKGDKNTVRSYSISSSENNRNFIQVSIKKIEGGLGSSWFHSLKKGDSVFAHPPSGHFVDNGEGDQSTVFISGGIGITPNLSMLRSLLEKPVCQKLYLFYGVRTKDDLAFHELLLHLKKRHNQFEYIPVLSLESDWQGEKGFITTELIKKYVTEFIDCKYFFCGPSVMTENLIPQLEQLGVNENNIFNEKFISPTDINISDLPERELTVFWNGQTFEYKGRKDLLSFLESQNQSIPFACRAGVCGSCRCKVEGDYDLLSDSGLTRQELKQGFSLACVTYPKSDVKISLK